MHGLDVIEEVLLLTRLRVRNDTELDCRAVVVVPLVLLLILEDEEKDTLRDLLNPDETHRDTRDDHLGNLVRLEGLLDPLEVGDLLRRIVEAPGVG